MKLFDILKKAGSIALRTIVPISGPIIDTVNAFLPGDKKLPLDATGEQVNRAVDTLSPEQQAQLLSKEYDVEIAEITSWTQIQSSLAEADKAGASTRPDIAKMMAWVVCYAEIIAISMWGYAVIKNQVSLENSWPLIVAILATPTALLRAYFGMRSKEKKSRYNAAIGQPAQSNIITDVLKLIRG
jgi:DNA-binding protein